VSGKGVGDPDGWWAHLIYTAYPRRAENELPPELRCALAEAASATLHARERTPPCTEA
jgi:hypothetical protein